jgi:hypothetical protein
LKGIKLSKNKRRLWYSKDDYKREREEELARRAQQEQNEKLTAQPNVDVGAAEPESIDSQVQPVEIDQAALKESESQQTKAEDQTKLQITGGNQQPEQILPVTEETLRESTQNATSDQFQVNEPAGTPIETNQQAPVEGEITQPLVEAENKPASMMGEEQNLPTETNQVTVEAESQEAQTEGQVIVPIEAPKSTEPSVTSTAAEVVAVPIVEPVNEEEQEVAAEMTVPLTASVESVEKFTQTLKYLLPTRAVVCIGEYPINILLKGDFVGKKTKGVLPIFVEKFSKDVIKWGQGKLESGNVICLDEETDTHFWYDILPFMASNESFFAKIKSKPLDKLKGAILVSSTWNGIGSALLPTINAQFTEWNLNSVALALLPSKAQPLDGQFNSFASMGMLVSKESTTAILLDRDKLEDYTGVDSDGFAINGNEIINYILELMLSKETFVPELCEMSKAFGSKIFTVMLAPGVSMKIYGSLENMLNNTLTRPLFNFDLSTATLLYVLIRMPFKLKDKLPRGKIELAIDNWFKDKADLESIYIADPVYIDDNSDRIDIALFIGGFDIATRFKALQARVEKMKNKAVKKCSITEEDWQLISKNLVE